MAKLLVDKPKERGRTWPTLYKKNADGSFQEWTIKVDFIGPDEAPLFFPVVIRKYGKVGGKIQVASTVIKKGKNVGRANETTPYEQAISEAESQWKGKKTGAKGYVETIEDAAEEKADALVEGGFLPMLAKNYKDYGHKINWDNAYAQPKLDGIRCIAIVKGGKATLWTRTRKPITSMPHVIEALEDVYKKVDVVFDGELYSHRFKKDFEKLVSMVRSAEPKEGCEIVEYHIFDTISNKPFEDRFVDFQNINRLVFMNKPAIKIVETVEVTSEDKMLEAFRGYTAMGYEGAIIRNGGAPYEQKRSVNLQKFKKMQDAEFEIVEVVEGRGKMEGAAIFVCKTDNGAMFRVKMEGPIEVLQAIYANRETYYGKLLTVRYQELTRDGIPRFPIGVIVRDYE